MHREITRLIVSSGLVCAVLLGVFYFFSLRPKLILPHELLKTEKFISEHYFNLLQNRLSITALVKLNPNDPNFVSEKNSLLATLQKTNEAGLKALEKEYAPKNSAINPTQATRFLNKDLNPRLPKLLAKNKNILEQQKATIQQLTELANTQKNLFLYNPAADLGHLDIERNTEAIATRCDNAIQGLETILHNLAPFENDNKKIQELKTHILETQSTLKDLIDSAKSNSKPKYYQTATVLIANFEKLRGLGLESELAVIRSPEIVVLLTDQTNLILEYEFWLKKINRVQEDLSELDLYKLF